MLFHNPNYLSKQLRIQNTLPGIKQRLFIVGCPRSGTTLVQAILASSPQVFTIPETHYFCELYNPRNRWLRGITGELALAKLCDKHPKLKPFRPLPILSYRHAVLRFKNWMDEQALSAGCTTWVEKTPLHFRHIEQIQWHPCLSGARFIHVLRNMEDTVKSLLKAGRYWNWPRTMEEAIGIWAESVQNAFNYASRPGHYFVRYESLLSDPELVARELFTFADIDAVVNWQMHLDQTSKRIVSPDELPWKGRNLCISGVAREASSLELTPREQAILEAASHLLHAITARAGS